LRPNTEGDVVWIEHEYYTWLKVREDGSTIPPAFKGPVPVGITSAVHRDMEDRSFMNMMSRFVQKREK
jgi:hypothetical protein